MFCRPPRKISIIVPLVVQIVIVMIANIATDGPLSHSHHDSSKTSPLSHDGASSTPNTPRKLWMSPFGSSNQLMSSIGRMRLTSPDVRNSTSQISVMAIADVTDGKYSNVRKPPRPRRKRWLTRNARNNASTVCTGTTMIT